MANGKRCDEDRVFMLAKNGNARATEQIWQLYYRYLVGYLRRRGCGLDDAWDLASQVLDNAFLRPYRSQGTLQNWLNRCAFHAFVDHLRGDKSEQNKVLALTLNLLDGEKDRNRSTDPTSYTTRIVLKDAIRQLPDIQQQVIDLFDFQEMSAKEIAEQLEIDAKKVYALRYAALKQLREILTDQGYNQVA